MTPREISIVADAFNEDQRERQIAEISMAHLTAALVRAKEFPKLADILPKKPETREQKKERLLGRLARFKKKADKQDRKRAKAGK